MNNRVVIIKEKPSNSNGQYVVKRSNIKECNDSDMDVFETKRRHAEEEIIEIHGTSSEEGEVTDSENSSTQLETKKPDQVHNHCKTFDDIRYTQAKRKSMHDVSDDYSKSHKHNKCKLGHRKHKRRNRSHSSSSEESLHRRRKKIEELLAAENSKHKKDRSPSKDSSNRRKRKSDEVSSEGKFSFDETSRERKRGNERTFPKNATIKREKVSMARDDRQSNDSVRIKDECSGGEGSRLDRRHRDRISTESSDDERSTLDRRPRDRKSPDIRIKKEPGRISKESNSNLKDKNRDGQQGSSNSDKRRRHQEDKDYDWGSANGGDSKVKTEPVDKDKPDFQLSGKLTEDRNMVNGVVIKYSEPPEARMPKKRWRLYPFKENQAMPTLYIHRQSAYLIGRDRKIADLPVDHPSCSKQHAALQYRLVSYERPNGTMRKAIRLYIIDLESANGTFVNNKKIEPKRYVELLEKDVIKFGFSSREYVLLHEGSKGGEDSG